MDNERAAEILEKKYSCEKTVGCPAGNCAECPYGGFSDEEYAEALQFGFSALNYLK